MEPSAPIYMDNHATTRADPRVVEAMLPYFSEHYGNAASRSHEFGWKAQDAVEQARAQVAELIGAQAREIIFTSGATESDNLAIKGVTAAYREQGNHIITTAIEHPAVLDPCRALAPAFQITVLPVDSLGLVTKAQVERAIIPETILVSVMAANHEIGTIQPLAEIGRLCKERKVLFHTDAAQAAGKISIDVEEMGIDLLTLSGHKMYGPKGVGALFVRRRSPHVRLQPLFDGGGQERGLRSGTLNVPGIVGLGEVCRLCREYLASDAAHCLALRERLRIGLLSRISDCHVNGALEPRLPGNLNLCFAGIHGEALLAALRTVAVSSGSACTSASIEPSYVLKAIGLSDDQAHGSLRFGLGRFSTEAEVDFTIDEVARLVTHLRGLTPTAQAASF